MNLRYISQILLKCNQKNLIYGNTKRPIKNVLFVVRLKCLFRINVQMEENTQMAKVKDLAI